MTSRTYCPEQGRRKGFTIVELLTVMSIIIILMSVLVPGLQRTRRYAKVVVQKGQFHEINKGMELYRNDHQETFPDSGTVDTTASTNGGPFLYCGANKLCEALLGQDGLGNHPKSNFQTSQPDTYRFDLCYITNPSQYTGTTADPCMASNIRERTKYTDAENIKAYRLQDIYNWSIATTGTGYYNTTARFKVDNGSTTTPSTSPNAVIGDVFQTAIINGTPCPARAGQKVGMPVLYYKADPSKLAHDTTTDPATWRNATTPYPNIYNFDDNYAITSLGLPWEGGTGPVAHHPMLDDPRAFLKAITNDKITSTPRPHNEDGYILLSAGWDGLYGTQDDVYNFAR
jgi:type II secretory pathway pseudopilin PulG